MSWNLKAQEIHLSYMPGRNFHDRAQSWIEFREFLPYILLECLSFL